ncbi:MAG: hypothetical protein HW421_482 [Ignavibacteria bacterium]|nr:hypothetical protein [Ignavibacteria bacterium]
MGNSITFDTLAYTKKLREVGFTEQQAEVQAQAIVELIEDKIATKRDLKELETTLQRDIKELELRMIIKLGALLAMSIAIVAVLVKLL